MQGEGIAPCETGADELLGAREEQVTSRLESVKKPVHQVLSLLHPEVTRHVQGLLGHRISDRVFGGPRVQVDQASGGGIAPLAELSDDRHDVPGDVADPASTDADVTTQTAQLELIVERGHCGAEGASHRTLP